jgi:hypothetical protein
MPPRLAMGPTWVRMRVWSSVRSWVSERGEEEGDEVVTKAKGSWPLRASGMPTTQASVTRGCEVMACSRVPVLRRWAATLMMSSVVWG